MATPDPLPAYVEIRGAAYMLCHSWTGPRIYTLHSLHTDRSRPVYYAADALPAHTVITREQAAEMHAATIAEFDRTHTPHPRPGRHPDA